MVHAVKNIAGEFSVWCQVQKLATKKCLNLCLFFVIELLIPLVKHIKLISLLKLQIYLPIGVLRAAKIDSGDATVLKVNAEVVNVHALLQIGNVIRMSVVIAG